MRFGYKILLCGFFCFISFRSIHQIQLQSQNRDLIYNTSNHSSRIQSPLTQTPVGSPNTIRKLAKRRAWFPPEVSFEKFKPEDDSNDDDVIMSRENSLSENETFNNSKVCDILIEHSSPCGQRKRNTIPDNRNIIPDGRNIVSHNPRHRRQQSLNSSYNGESDSTSYDSDAFYCYSRSSKSSSLRSSTSNLLLTPDYEVPTNPFVFGATQQQQQQQQQLTASETWYIPNENTATTTPAKTSSAIQDMTKKSQNDDVVDKCKEEGDGSITEESIVEHNDQNDKKGENICSSKGTSV